MKTLDRTSAFVSRHFHWVAFAVAAAAILAHGVYLQPWTLDDAYINMRYAENFAQGHGLVFNPGSRVEGYTAVLWVVLLGVGKFFGWEPEAAAKVLGAFFAIGCLLLLANTHKFIEQVDQRVSVAATLFLGTCGVFSVWAMGGMEVPMVAFWVLLSILLHYRSKAAPDDKLLACLVGVTCALATWSRPESGLVFVVLWVDRFVDGVRNRNRAFLYFGLAFVGLYLPYFVWRYLYYGYLLPNTFYAKVGGTWAQLARGARYLGEFAWVSLFVLAPAMAAIFFCGSVARRYVRIDVVIWFFVLHTAYVVGVGGDLMPAYRFFAPNMPVICLLAALAVGALSQSRVGLAATLTAIVAFNVLQSVYHGELNERVVNRLVGRAGKEVGIWMRDHFPPDTVIAVNAAGSVPYFSGFEAIDMLGLNDTHIAHRKMPDMGRDKAGHEKGDGAYVLAAKPDVIQLGSSLGRKTPLFVSGREMYRSQEFQESYELRSYRLPSGRNLWLYERKESGRHESGDGP